MTSMWLEDVNKSAAVFRFFYYISNEVQKMTQEAKISREHLDWGVAGWGNGERVGWEGMWDACAAFLVGSISSQGYFSRILIFKQH